MSSFRNSHRTCLLIRSSLKACHFEKEERCHVYFGVGRCPLFPVFWGGSRALTFLIQYSHVFRCLERFSETWDGYLEKETGRGKLLRGCKAAEQRFPDWRAGGLEGTAEVSLKGAAKPASPASLHQGKGCGEIKCTGWQDQKSESRRGWGEDT